MRRLLRIARAFAMPDKSYSELYAISPPPVSPQSPSFSSPARKYTTSPIPTSPQRNYAFISSPPESRFMASHAAPRSPGRKLKLLSPNRRNRTRSSAQANEIRPATDWGFLMSGPMGGGQKHVVQRPWPEYVPESSAPVGRTWNTCTRRPPPHPDPTDLRLRGRESMLSRVLS